LLRATLEMFGYYFDFEKNYRWEHVGPYLRDNYAVMFALTTAYVVLVHLGRSMMEKRTAFHLKPALQLWNGFLTLLSWAMFLRLVPGLYESIAEGGLQGSVCTSKWADGPSGFWVMIFTLSKIPELIDTLFIVLRKSKLEFLHWYHHTTVLMFNWFAFSNRASTGMWFATMNALIHSIMYFYFFLTGMGYRPKWNLLLTLGQIAQMVVGVIITVNDLVNTGCASSTSYWGGIMYFSYFLLFTQFFIKKYCLASKQEKKVIFFNSFCFVVVWCVVMCFGLFSHTLVSLILCP